MRMDNILVTMALLVIGAHSLPLGMYSLVQSLGRTMLTRTIEAQKTDALENRPEADQGYVGIVGKREVESIKRQDAIEQKHDPEGIVLDERQDAVEEKHDPAIDLDKHPASKAQAQDADQGYVGLGL